MTSIIITLLRAIFKYCNYLRLTGETVDGFFVGGSALGNPRTAAAKVGEAAASELIDSISRSIFIDQYLQDQVFYISHLHLLDSLTFFFINR